MQVDASVLESVSAQHLLKTLSEAALPLILFAETGLLFGFFLPGDSLLFVAGYATVEKNSLGLHLSLPVVLTLAPIAAIVGAQVGYEIGRRAGPRVFSRPNSRFLRAEHVERTQGVLEQFGYGRAIVLARFVPIVRTFLNPLVGTTGYSAKKFFLWNVVGALLWTVGLVLLGHAIGNVGFIRRHIEPLALLVVLLSVLPLLFELTRRRVRSRRR